MDNRPRIIAGKYKNQKLDVPKSARPITDRIKQSVFDTIQPYIKDAVVLDLFAGSGSIGIEALSRGAKEATFIEINEEAAELLSQNKQKLQVPDESFNLIRASMYKIFTQLSYDYYDIVFADPPFPEIDKFKVNKIERLLTEDGVFILRSPSNFHLKSTWKPVYEEILGESRVSYYRKS